MKIVMPKERAINWIILFVKFCKDWNIILVDKVDNVNMDKEELTGVVVFPFHNYKPGIC
jgi:hypothetical protein